LNYSHRSGRSRQDSQQDHKRKFPQTKGRNIHTYPRSKQMRAKKKKKKSPCHIIVKTLKYTKQMKSIFKASKEKTTQHSHE
jgi:hypothetical protein